MAWTPPTQSTTARSYGAAHRRERDRYAHAIDRGELVTCHFCGEPITISNGRHRDGLHLDHSVDRTTYRGPAHNHCNVRDGAKRGRAKQNAPRRRLVL